MSYQCKFCDKNYDSEHSLLTHSRKHGLNSESFYLEYKLNNIKPTCKCGCGEETEYISFKKGFNDYIIGHHARVHNNWGHNPEALKKSQETKRQKWDNGEYEAWNKGMTYEEIYGVEGAKEMREMLSSEERCKNVSDAMSGRTLSKEHSRKLRKINNEYWSKSENRLEQRKRTIDRLQKRQFNEISNLERNFKYLLDELGISYTHQYKLSYYLFDFRIKDTNILIEVDGDFYHCNPDIYDEPVSEVQVSVIENDKKKNVVAKNKEFKLVRFWEYDIINNTYDVVDEILRLTRT